MTARGSYFLAGLVPLLVFGCATAPPEPSYIVLGTEEGYEIREYGRYLVAEIELAGEYRDSLYKGFRILFDYINGYNTRRESMDMAAPILLEPGDSSEKIPMTAPVLMEKGDEKYVISFVMPLKYTLEMLPRPKDRRIKIKQIEGRKVAALIFSWSATERRVSKKLSELRKRLARDGYIPASPFRAAYYNPPWTLPFLRRNEILVEIE